MNKNFYRIVFNKARGQRMVVQETATAHGGGRGETRGDLVRAVGAAVLTAALSCVAFAVIALSNKAYAQIVADPGAPGTRRPAVLNAGNGVPLVNIQTPSAAGVSRNTYSQFDVQRPGAILNNSRTNVQTQLGGWVQGNPWLATGSAKVILNEINSANPSLLKGYVEVAGQKADVIIANPAGIKVDGAGFINAGNVVLTTGTPTLGSQGNLESYRVQRGTVVIEGLGLDTRTATITQILARAAEINAGLWANYLTVITGANEINAANPDSATPIAGTGPKPSFSLDVAAIGGMYAGHIRLIGTEAGLSFNNSGVFAASEGKLVLLEGGRLINTGQIQAKGDVQINATGGIDNSGTIHAAGNASLATQGGVTNAGLIAAQGNVAVQANGVGSRISSTTGSQLLAGLNPDGTVGANGALNLGATAGIALNGQTSANAITLATQSLNTDGGALSAGQVSLTATSLSNIAGEILQTGTGELSIQLAGSLGNAGGLIAANGAVTLSAATINNTRGTVASVNDKLTASTTGITTNDSGRMQAALDVSLGNAGLSNAMDAGAAQAGSITGRNISIDTARSGAAQVLNNSQGTIAASNTVTLLSGALNNNAGLIQSGGAMAIDTHGQTLANTNAASHGSGAGGIASEGTLQLNTGDVNNAAGYIGAKGAIAGTSAAVSNTAGGQLIGESSVALNVTGFDNRGGQVQVLGDVTLNAGAGVIYNTASLIRSAGTASLTAAGVVNSNTIGTNQGIEGNDIAITAATVANGAGAIRANRNVTLAASASVNNNAGLLSAGNALTVQGSVVGASRALAVTNAGGIAIGGQAATITAASLTGTGKVLSKGTLDIDLSTDLNNTGEITANGNARVATTGTLTNSGKLQSGATLTVSAHNAHNAATGEIAGVVTKITAAHTLTNRGLIDGQDTQLNAAMVNNIGTGRIYGDYLSIGAGTVSNDVETVNSVTTAATIAARERLDIGAQTINNREHALMFSVGDLAIGGALNASRQATGQAAAVNNASATIEALSNLSIGAVAVNNTNSHFAMTAGTPQTEDRHEFMYDAQLGHVNADQVFIYQQRDGNGNYFNATLLSPVARADGADIYVNMGNCWCDVAQPFTAEWNEYQFQRTTLTDTVASSDPGRLLSGKNLAITGNLTNDKSQVIAGAALSVVGGTAANIEAMGSNTVTDSGQTRLHTFVKGNHHGIDKWFDWAPYTLGTFITTAVVPVSVYLSNAAPTGSGLTLDHAATAAVGVNPGAAGAAAANVRAVGITQVTASVGAAVISTVGVNSAIPGSSLYRVNPSATSGYLIETDPRFTNLAQWLSSDYMLSALGIDPTTLQKRLGDGFYEQRLIQEQILQLTGQRFLGDYSSDDEQYTALMNGGLTLATALDLRPGIALTAQQMAQLTSDIVWLVEQDVTLPDGSKTRALVPQVYARVRQGDLDGSGTLLAGKSVNLKLSGDLTNSGTIAGRQVVDLTAENVQNIAGRINGAAVSVTARNDLNNIGGQISTANSLSVVAGRDLNIITTTQGAAKATGNASYASQGIDRVAGLYVTGDKGLMIASAGRDANLVGAQIINARQGGSTSVSAGRDVNLGTSKTANSEQVTWNATNYRKDAVTQEVGTQIQGAGSVELRAGQDVNAKAATVQAGGALNVAAGRDINVSAGQQTSEKEYATQTTKKGFLSRTTTTTYDHVEQTTAVGSSFSGNTVNLKADQDAKLTGSQVTAQWQLAIEAGRDIKLQSAQDETSETHTSQSVKKASGLGQLLGAASVATGAFTVGAALLTKTQGNQAGEQTNTQAVGSTLSAGSIRTTSGRDTAAQGATVVADGDIDMKTGRNLTLEAAQDTSTSASQSSSRKSGFIGSILQPAIGTVKQSQDAKDTSTTQVGSTVASLNGNVTLKADGTYTQTASQVLALEQGANTGNVSIQGQQVLINEAYDTQTGARHTQTSKTAIGGSVSVPLLEAAKALKNTAEATGRAGDARMQTLGAATMAMQANALADSAKAVIGNGNVGGFKASISLGSSKSESTSEQSSTTVVGSQVNGNNVSIKAAGDGKNSNVVISGSDITAKETASVTADGKVILQAATNTAQQHSTNRSSGASIGIGFAMGGSQNGFTLDIGANKARGNADGGDTTQANTHVSAGNQANINSGGDTSLRGAVVTAPTVKADVGGNLNVESLQDKSTYTEASKSASVGVSLCIPPFCVGASNASGSAGNTSLNSNYASVNEQSGIRAGDGGFQVDVKGGTDLKGGAITSTQKAIDHNKNSFNSAGGTTTSDIQNSASYDAKGYSIGASVGTGTDPKGQNVPGGSAGVGQDKGSATSTTQAAISGIAGNKDARTGDTETGIKPIFDKQKGKDGVNAQVAIAVEFGRQAPKAWADYAQTRLNDLKDQTRAAAQAGDKQGAKELFDEAKKWGEGGEYRVAGHTLLGALAGGAGGAAGALASTTAMPEIGKLIGGTDLPEAVKQGLGMVASATLGGIVGGTAGTAGSFNVDTNNRQLHPSELKWIADNRKAFAQKLSQALDRHVTELEAMHWLTAAGESNVDAASQRSNAQFARGPSNTENSQAYDTAKAFIAENTRTGSSFIDERGQAQSLFSARNGEFYKPEVYGAWKDDPNYRDYYWTVMGINLRGDAMSEQEQALYEQREQIVREQQLKQLATLTVQAAAGKVASNVAARAGQPAPPGQARLKAEEAAAIERARIENNINADLPNVYVYQRGGVPLGKPIATYDMANNVGPLPISLGETFAGGRYVEIVLTQDTILYRAGTKDVPLGQFFSTDIPLGVRQARIDKAILPKWPGGGESPVDSAFAVKIPSGTKVYVGATGTQNSFYVGGSQQIVVQKPWLIPGVEAQLLGPLK